MVAIHPSVCPGIFLKLDHKFFLNFCVETHIKLCLTKPDFSGGNFAPKIGFLGFIKKLGP